MTRVIVDRNAGFCAGVRRAIRGTRELLSRQEGMSARAEESARIVAYGQLVHNREVTDSLAAQGLEHLDDLQDAEDGDTVVLRTHGISPQEEQLLHALPVEIRDFTCPRVKKVHLQIREKREAGYRIVIVGDPQHAEVRAFLGWAGEDGIAVTGPDNLQQVPPECKLAVFAQTTITPRLFEAVLVALEKLGVEMSVIDTLCPFVQKRQRWIDGHSRRADASLIVGGKNSSNTRKLFTLAAGNGPAFHISRAEELDTSAILRYPLVALTAGASTGDRTIREVIACLKAAGARIEYG